MVTYLPVVTMVTILAWSPPVPANHGYLTHHYMADMVIYMYSRYHLYQATMVT